ncbi:putative membrane protein [Mycobacterium xenopi 4042]|uniref:Putative membrane protein n=1 Tax=Mycobacterium xenopi 4042 TaxID=1299334 RepID=X7YNP3_MYCXE|nr:putative membrane protein [Mycobacterium xenopi 4042]
MLRSVGLLVFIAVVALTFSLAARATGGVDREQRRPCRARWRTR